MNRFLAFARALLFLAAALPVGAATLALMIAGWTATAVLSVTPLVVPVLMGFRRATGLLAAADAALARSLLGVEARPNTASGGTGYWRRGWAVLAASGHATAPPMSAIRSPRRRRRARAEARPGRAPWRS